MFVTVRGGADARVVGPRVAQKAGSTWLVFPVHRFVRGILVSLVQKLCDGTSTEDVVGVRMVEAVTAEVPGVNLDHATLLRAIKCVGVYMFTVLMLARAVPDLAAATRSTLAADDTAQPLVAKVKQAATRFGFSGTDWVTVLDADGGMRAWVR